MALPNSSRTTPVTSLTLHRKLLEWIDKKVGPFKPYKTRTQAVEHAIIHWMESEGEDLEQLEADQKA